jgi:hypothetical protein
MDAQDDVKGMLAAVKEDPQASEEEVIVLSSQQPPAGSLKSGPHVEPKVEPKVEPQQFILARPNKKKRSARAHSVSKTVESTGRPTVGQLRLKGAADVTSDKKTLAEGDKVPSPMERNVAKVKNSQGGFTSFGGEISDTTAEGSSDKLDPIKKIWTSR